MNGKDFYAKIRKSIELKNAVNIFENIVKKTHPKERILQNDIWEFLKHLFIVSFDFTHEVGFHYNNLKNSLIQATNPTNVTNGGILFNSLYAIVAELEPIGGSISRISLKSRLEPTLHHFTIPYFSGFPKTVVEKLTEQIEARLHGEKTTRKYIPEIFIEAGTIKEKARYFSDPFLFQHKLCDEINRLYLWELNRLLAMIEIPPLTIQSPNLRTDNILSALEHNIGQISCSLCSVTKYINNLNHRYFSKSVPQNKRYIYDKIAERIAGTAEHIQNDVKNLESTLDMLKKRIWIITSEAGRGKTNFICDFIENNIRRKQIPAIFFVTSRDFYNESIETALCRTIQSNSSLKDLNSSLKTLDDLGNQNNSISLIVFDALNEHGDTKRFSYELEDFFTNCMKYPHIRILATCRLEYFKERFSNLSQGKYASDLVIESGYPFLMDDNHKYRLFKGYFTYFNIIYSSISELAFRDLTENPLFLRIFCEAYSGDGDTIPNIDSVHKEPVFHEYHKRKGQEFAEKHAKHWSEKLAKRKYSDSIYSLIDYMIQHRVHSEISVSSLSEDHIDVIEGIIDEDVLLRKDIRNGEESVSFTYDALRDYFIAQRLIDTVLPQEGEAIFNELVNHFTNNDFPCAEGVQLFLFCHAKNRKKTTAIRIIEGLVWYKTTHIHNIFELNDDVATDNDCKLVINTICNNDVHRDGKLMSTLINHLLVRNNESKYKKLNISCLFDAIYLSERSQRISLLNFIADQILFYNTPFPLEKVKFSVEDSSTDSVSLQNLVHIVYLLEKMCKSYYANVKAEILQLYKKKYPNSFKVIERKARELILRLPFE